MIYSIQLISCERENIYLAWILLLLLLFYCRRRRWGCANVMFHQISICFIVLILLLSIDFWYQKKTSIQLIKILTTTWHVTWTSQNANEKKTEIDELQFRGNLSPKKSTQRKLRALQIWWLGTKLKHTHFVAFREICHAIRADIKSFSLFFVGLRFEMMTFANNESGCVALIGRKSYTIIELKEANEAK